MKGALKFMAYILLAAAACFDVAAIASGDTVMKKPAL